MLIVRRDDPGTSTITSRGRERLFPEIRLSTTTLGLLVRSAGAARAGARDLPLRKVRRDR